MTAFSAFRIRHGLPLRHRPDAAGLIWAAFGSQVARGLGTRAGRALVRRSLQGQRILAAVDEGGALLGLVGLRGPEGGLLDLRPAVLRRMLGRAGWMLHLARVRAPAGRSVDLVLDGLVVAPEARGRGVARALIRAAAARAAALGHPGLRAEVARDNHPARRLYQGMGFARAAARRWPVWRGPLVMRLPLDPGPPLSRTCPRPAPAG